MYNNPYFMYQPRMQPMEQNIQQPVQPIQPIPQSYIPTVQNSHQGLLGKQVESIDVVKATEVPFDGSVSYFPLSDGTSIITKKIQNDGTSKITIYKPVSENEKEEPRYATVKDIERAIDKIDLGDLQQIKDDLSSIKQQLKNLENTKKR